MKGERNEFFSPHLPLGRSPFPLACRRSVRMDSVAFRLAGDPGGAGLRLLSGFFTKPVAARPLCGRVRRVVVDGSGSGLDVFMAGRDSRRPNRTTARSLLRIVALLPERRCGTAGLLHEPIRREIVPIRPLFVGPRFRFGMFSRHGTFPRWTEPAVIPPGAQFVSLTTERAPVA